MSLKKTLVLALILLVALGYIYEVKLPHEAEEKEKAIFLGGREREQVTSIDVSNQYGKFSLVNTNPQAAPAQKKPKPSPAPFESVDPQMLKRWEMGGLKGADLDSSTLNALL